MALGSRSPRRLNNPLIQRVRRHTAFTTLFRKPVEQPAPFDAAPGGVRPGRPASAPLNAPVGTPAGVSTPAVPVVSASLTPVEAAGFPEPTPSPAASPPTIAPPASRAPVEPPQAPAPRPAQPPVQRQAESIPVQAQPEQARPQTPADSGDDPIWRRLQNIFRRHEEKRQAEEASAPEPASEPEVAADRLPGESPPVVQRAAETPVPETQPRPVAPPNERRRAVIEEQPRQNAAEPPARPEPESGTVQLTPAAQPMPADHPMPDSGQEISPRALPVPPQPAEQAGPPARPVPPETPPVQRAEASTEETVIQPPDTSQVEEPPAATVDHPVETLQPSAPQVERPDIPAEGQQVDEVQLVDEMHPVDEPHPADEISPQDQAVPGPATAPGPVEGDHPLTGNPPDYPPDAPTQVAVQRHEAEDQPPVQPSRVEPGGPSKVPVPEQTVQPAAQPPDPEILQASVPPVSQDADLEQDRGVPLEAAWPVQRMGDAPDAIDTAAAPPSEAPPPSAELAASPQAQQVKGLLQSVQPGQPTGSSVEMVTPRRPRPVPVQPSRPEVQTLPVKGEQVAIEDIDLPVADAASAAEVETEIGPLPADLWRLIGQETPQQPVEEGESPQPEMPAQAAVQRQPDKPARPRDGHLETGQIVSTYTPGHISPQDLPDVVQMAARDTQVETRSADRLTRGDASEEGSGDEEDSGGEIDVDELSRKVYQEIKRRLTGEWERMRRRF